MSFDNFKDISISENFLEKYFEPLQKSFKELCDKKQTENINRGSRLFDLRFRLNMDLNVTINSQYSSTKTPGVKNIYETLFLLLDLWNVYEVANSNVKMLGLLEKNDKKFDTFFFDKDDLGSEIKNYLDFFNKEIKDSKICESFKNYLNHFKDLDSITQSNKAKYDEIIKKINDNTNFDVEDVLFLIYMERNAFYHGGEAAKSGTNYSFKQNLLNFYVVFLRYFIAEYGIKMFNKELEL